MNIPLSNEITYGQDVRKIKKKLNSMNTSYILSCGSFFSLNSNMPITIQNNVFKEADICPPMLPNQPNY